MSIRSVTPGSWPSPFPDLGTLHERHYGLSPDVNRSYAEAASVCLSRHDSPPRTIAVKGAGPDLEYVLDWQLPNERSRAAWDNADDATRDAAYCVVLAAAECHLGLFARRRANTLTGADYLVGPMLTDQQMRDPELNFEDTYRLEISGMDHPGADSVLRGRLRQKVEQAQRGRSLYRPLAGVVGFDIGLVLFAKAA